ncbi:MAG: hypothetical protein ACO1NO_11650 [Burkholderiaceae bacterium]
MKTIGTLVTSLAFLFGICLPVAANAQAPDFSGTWTGRTVCPIGPVEFTMQIQGGKGILSYPGYGPEKLYATEFPITVTFQQPEMYVNFAGPDQGADFGSFRGTLLADGSVDSVVGLKANEDYCDEFRLSRAEAEAQAGALGLATDGLVNAALFARLFEGDFSSIYVPADHAVFNSMFGAYLDSYARQCAADAGKRPNDFVEMTNLECGEERVTATYFRNGMYTESAPYCSRWDEVPNGLYADPKMWEVKRKLDDVLLGDTYSNVLAFVKYMEGGSDIFENAFEASPQMIMSAMATAVRDMDALVAMNACDSPGLMQFQENLRLYAINRPFGIRPDGSAAVPTPIPAAGETFKDPDYVRLLEDLVQGAARSWQANKYLLNSITNPSVTSRDALGRPDAVRAEYRFGGMGGMATGSVTLTFFEGYPECLYFFDKPNACRPPDKLVTSRYVHGGYALENSAARTPAELRAASEEAAKASEARRRQREQARDAGR